MAEGSWIRVKSVDAHLDASTVNSIIETALGQRAVSITQRPELRKEIGQAFIEVATKYVPVKDGNLVKRGYATNDGRVIWSAVNQRGENYAGYVYDQEKTRWPDGKTYVNPSKKPSDPRWAEKIHPGTDEWTTFVNNITPIIKEAFRNE